MSLYGLRFRHTDPHHVPSTRKSRVDITVRIGDLLQALGCLLAPPATHTRIPPAQHPYFDFLLAPNYHPRLGPLAPARHALPHRTLLSLVDPLVNPAWPCVRTRTQPTPRSSMRSSSVAPSTSLRSPSRGTGTWEVNRTLYDAAEPEPEPASSSSSPSSPSSPTITEYTIHPSAFDLPVHHLSGLAADWKEGVQKARSIDEMLAWRAFTDLKGFDHGEP